VLVDYYVRDVPGSFDTWIENISDQSHVPWAHHGVAHDRSAVCLSASNLGPVARPVGAPGRSTRQVCLSVHVCCAGATFGVVHNTICCKPSVLIRLLVAHKTLGERQLLSLAAPMPVACPFLHRSSEYANFFKISNVNGGMGEGAAGVTFDLEWSPSIRTPPELQKVTYSPPTYIGCA
jgi:hypothetical protein